MNSKELIAAAENCCTDSQLEWIDLDSPGYPICEDMMLDAYRLSKYILATVRADDDEPYDKEWGRSVVDASTIDLKNGFSIDVSVCDLEYEDTGIDVGGYGFTSLPIETRGEFRQLCRLLGVTLKEGE